MTTYWSAHESSECIRHISSDEAIEAFLDTVLPDAWDELEVFVREFARMKATLSADTVLDFVLEHLDEEFGCPDGGETSPTPAMRTAAETFVEAILAEYQSYYLEPTGATVQVNALEWIKANRPEWLGVKP